MKPDNKIETERLSKAMNDTPMNNFSDQGQKEPPLCLLSLSGGMGTNDVAIRNRLLSYSQLSKGEDNEFLRGLLERRQLRKQAKAERQAKNFNQNEK